MGALHDALDKSGYTGHALERFLVRLLFCLFADDTGIFQPLGIFEEFIANTREDGTDLGPMLSQLFQVLNTPENQRHRTLSEALARFPYVNGDLFGESLSQPSFDREMRERLLAVCGFKWEAISPAIFGSLFQSVLNKEERRKKGAHYTSEKNILKVIEPLFIDDLRSEFSRLRSLRRGKDKALEDFHDRLGRLTFFDPACGCGNFLVIAYRELRELEIALLQELHPTEQRVTDIGLYTKVNVDQFYGIEIEEFPCRIAEVAMWMMDHIMNVRLSAAFGESYLRIPLRTSPNVRHGDALEVNWNEVIEATRCSFIFGNPPFGGFVLRDAARQKQMEQVARLGASGSRLDYVTAWFLKAGEYVQSGDAAIAFVATNSISQGEQVPQLWPALFARYGLEIAFAHRTFEWLSDARGRAHVHCVIIGLVKRAHEPSLKRLFSYDEADGAPIESTHAALSPYLFDASTLSNRHLVVERVGRSLCGMPEIRVGSKPVDGGHYIFNAAERIAFAADEPKSAALLRPFIGGHEYINGEERWILVPSLEEPGTLRRLNGVRKRVEAVRQYRQQSKGNLANELAATPAQFHVTVVPDKPFLAIPEVSSERREYVPIGWLEPPAVPSNQILVIQNASLFIFGILTSRMHMAWLRFIGGRLESRYRYSSGIVYNPFPWPAASDKDVSRISSLAQTVLDRRAQHSGATLADLYDPDLMPVDLWKAHRALDEAVDGLYRKEPFSGDRERVERLFILYERLSSPVLAVTNAKRKRTSKRSKQT